VEILKKPFLILVILLLVSMVSMVMISQVYAQTTRIFVDPSSINLSQSPQSTTIRPMADSAYGSGFKEWTNNTVVLEPDSDSGIHYSDWTGRSLTLNPNGEGTYSQWPAWVHLQPRPDVDGNYSDWAGNVRDWDDWPNPDSPLDTVVSAPDATYNNFNETSALNHPPTEFKSRTIQKVRVNIVAKYSATSNEQLQIMLATVLNANASGREVDTNWNGWTRTGSSPWLDKEDYNANYIYTSATTDKIGNFTFADIPAGLTWSSPPHTTRGTGVEVRLRTWQSPLGNDAIRIYLYNGTQWKTLGTLLTPAAVPDPSYVSYGDRTDIDISDFLDTTDKINAAKMAIEKVTVGEPDTIYVDYACIFLSGVRKPASYGPSIGLSTSYTTKYWDWSTNPVYNIPWNWTAIDALQAGVKAIKVGDWTGAMWVTQLYVGILTSPGLYTDWDEYPNPTGPNGGDADYFVATADGLRQTSTLPNYAASPPFSTISKVRVTITARVNVTTDEKVQPLLVPGPTTTAEANVNGFTTTTGWTGWSRTAPWLNSADWSSTDGNYITSNVENDRIGNFTFQDIPPGITWTTVTLYIRTWSNGNEKLRIYLYNGASWTSYPEITPDNMDAPGNEKTIVVTDFLNTAAKINATKMAIEYVYVSGGKATIGVDHAYLYVSGGSTTFNANVDGRVAVAGWDGWTRVPTGTPPWLSAADYPANYIYTITGGDKIGVFSFASIPTDIPWGTWRGVTLRIKTWASAVAGGADGMTIELSNDGGSSWGFSSTVSSTNTTAPGNYVDIDVSDYLNTVAKVNLAKMRITKVTAGTADTVYVDHAYLFVSVRAYSLTTTYTEYTSEWSINPATGLAWTWSAIDALEVGVKSVQTGTWIGEIRVTQIYVKVMEAGTYAHWDEPPPDHNSDTDYNSATSGKLNQSSRLQDMPTNWQTWTISRVQVTIVVRADTSQTSTEMEKVRIMLVDETTGTQYLGPISPALTTSYATYTSVWTTNPAGGAWTWSAINGKEVGVQSYQGGNSWKGEIRVTQIFVVVGRDGTYENWDETSANGDNDYFSATMSGMDESSQLTDTTQSWTIGRVRVAIVAKTDIATDEQVQLILVIGGDSYPAAAPYTLNTTYTTYIADVGANPAYYSTIPPKPGPWNWTAINALEVGVTSLKVGDEWKGEIRVTQLYVEIAGPRFTVEIKVENVVGLYGYDIKLKYNTAVTTATAIIFNYTFLVPDETVQYTEVNDAAGYARFSTSSDTVAVSGSGTLATIIFLIDSTGATTLDLRVKDFYNYGLSQIYKDIWDVERDRKIDTYDLSILSNAYGYKSGDPSWTDKSICDFNSDNKVDVLDLFDMGKNYGKAYAYDGYFSNSP